MAAAMVKNRPRPSRYNRRITSPWKENSGACPATGKKVSAAAAVQSDTIGPILKIHVVLVLYTDPFLNNLISV